MYTPPSMPTSNSWILEFFNLPDLDLEDDFEPPKKEEGWTPDKVREDIDVLAVTRVMCRGVAGR